MQQQQTPGIKGICFLEYPHYNISNVQFSRKQYDMQKRKEMHGPYTRKKKNRANKKHLSEKLGVGLTKQIFKFCYYKA